MIQPTVLIFTVAFICELHYTIIMACGLHGQSSRRSARLLCARVHDTAILIFLLQGSRVQLQHDNSGVANSIISVISEL